MKITKSKIEVYRIRELEHGQWADITIDAGEKRGRVQVASDFGDFQYYWGSCGVPFIEFLQSLDIHYAAGKFKQDDWFDFGETLRQLNQEIEENTEHSPEEIEQAKREASVIAGYHNKGEFIFHLHNCETLMKICNYTPYIVNGISPQFRQFWETCWIPLMSHFKNQENGKD